MLRLVGAAHQPEHHHLPLFFLGGEWQLLISERELESPAKKAVMLVCDDQ